MEKYREIVRQRNNRRAELERRLKRIEKDLRKPHARDFEDQAVERENEEVVDALDRGTLEELKQIEDALTNIEQNKYGKCVDCGEIVPVERLKILPFTNRCTKCAQEYELEKLG